jgi:hydrogenase-4 component F
VGILAIGLGIGGGALFGALFHLINNGLTKGVLFLSSGNIHRSYNSKSREVVSGAMRRLPLSGGLFLAGFFAITGSPPFAPFLSEFTIIRATLVGGNYLTATAMLLFMATIFIGMAGTVLPVVSGDPPANAEETGYRDRFLTIFPPLALLLVVLLLGLWMPPLLGDTLRQAAALLEASP